MKESIKVTGSIRMRLIRDGKVIVDKNIKNLITNAGLAEMAGLVGATGSPSAFTYLAVGTGTTAANAANTTLETEITDTGLERAASTVSRVTTTQTNDTLQLLKSWAATGAKAVTEIGALNAVSTGDLLGRQVFSVINVTTDDVLEMTYRFAFA